MPVYHADDQLLARVQWLPKDVLQGGPILSIDVTDIANDCLHGDFLPPIPSASKGRAQFARASTIRGGFGVVDMAEQTRECGTLRASAMGVVGRE